MVDRPGTGTPGAGTGPSTRSDATADIRDSLLDRALHLAQIGRIGEAYPLLAEALRDDPGDSHTLLVYAYCYQQEGRWADALTVLDIAARRAPDNSQLHRYRSISLLQLDRVAESLEAAERARTLDPDDARNELVRAEALLRRSGTRTVLAAEVATRRARELDPENTWAHFTEATVQRRMAEFGRARAAYLEALRLAPDNPAALHGLGTLDADRGRAVRAAPVLGGMLQVEPNDPAALRAATFGARQVLWTLTDLGCVLLLLANLVVLVIQESLPSRTLGAAVGMTVTVVAGAGVLALLRWRLARLPGPVRALLRANRYRPTVAAAPLRLAALVIAGSVISLDPYLPEAVEELGAILFSLTLLTLLLRWRNRAVREVLWFVRRCWFRLHRRPAAEP